MRPLGIRSRILLAALAPAFLVAVLITGVLVAEQLKHSHIEQHRRLAALARQLAAAAEYNMFVGDHERLRTLLDAAIAEPDVRAAAVLDARGQVLASTVPEMRLPRPEDILDGFSPDLLAEEDNHWHGHTIRASNYGEDDLFAGLKGNEAPPLGQLLLLVSNQSLNDELRRHALTASLAALLILLFGMLLALALSREMVRILGEIGSVVEGIGAGRTHLRVKRIGTDELGHLAEGINEMAVAVAQTQEDLARRIEKATLSLRRERDEAEAASRARSRFFAAASHDLRQPLQALGLFVDRLEHDAANSPLLPRVSKIVHTVQGLQGLLDTLLDYSRLEGKVYRVERRPVYSAEVIRRVAEDFAETARSRHLELRTRMGDCWLMTDPALLHRILLNLVSNAVRYTQKGGVLVACRTTASHAHIEVWDTGPGIPDDAQQAVFDELVQLENPERDAAKGLGLGLAIVRRTADLLHHPLQLCSEVGRGSRFRITIPLAPASLGHGDQEPPSDDPLENARILLICAHAGEQAELLAQLDGWGSTVSVAANADEAAGWVVSRGAPDLVVWDAQGGAAGAELAMAMIDWLCTRTHNRLPALIISSGPVPAPEPQPGEPRRLLLARPFRPARLRAMLTRALTPQSADAE
jgi:signal transduction histidine kinase